MRGLPRLLDNILAPAARAQASYGANAAGLVEKGELTIVGGLYHLDSGKIDWLDTPAAQGTWVAAGLSALVGPEIAIPAAAEMTPEPVKEPWTAGLVPDAAVFLGSLALLALFQVLWISEGRWVASVKFRGRLAASFLAVVGYSAVYTGMHYRGFRKFLGDQKQKWEKTQAAKPQP